MCFACDLLVTTPNCQFGYPPMRAMGMDIMWFPWLLPMRKAAEMACTGDSITGEEAYRLGMANYCVRAEDIDEFTDTFAKRVALMPWQLATLYKRAVKKAYEVRGIRTAVETGALFMLHMAGETDYAQQLRQVRQEKGLREFLTARDGRYNDYRTAQNAILARTQREGEEWKGVSAEARPK